MTAHWIKVLKMKSSKKFMAPFSTSHPPAPWNLLWGLKLGGFHVRRVIDTWITPEIPPKDFIGPRWLISAALEDTGGAPSILDAIMKYYPDCKQQKGSDKFVFDMHKSPGDCMKAVLDCGLEIIAVSVIGPDEDEKKYVVLKVLLPLQSASQCEIGEVILKEHGIAI